MTQGLPNGGNVAALEKACAAARRAWDDERWICVGPHTWVLVDRNGRLLSRHDPLSFGKAPR